jgi:MYXO-CTERM domain-containing protein
MQTRSFFWLSAVLSLAIVAAVSRSAEAHFTLMMPPSADATNDGGKGAPPCGPTTASGVVTPVQGGHPLSISILETIGHPGHYRFALSVNSRTELPADPPVTTAANGNSTGTTIQNPPIFPVLTDGMFPHTTATNGVSWVGTIMLPNITCAKCTLQVIEYMNMHSLNDGGGYFYHHCADLAITRDPALPGDGGAPDVGGGTGGRTGTGGTAGGTGGRAGTGGSNGTAGSTGTAGASGTGGSNGAAGAAGGVGGTTGGAGVGGSSGGDAGNVNVETPTEGGCSSCAVGARGAGAAGWTAAGLLIVGLLLRRRRRQ